MDTVKLDAVEEAEKIGNMFVTFFVIFGLFSIAAGVMLIFMIFVMLAAERKPEMGMARAVGAQRTSLIQGFLAEGMSYNILAGAVGIALGVGASVALVVGYLRYSLGGDFDFIEAHVTAQSLIISYCLGASLTFLTVVIASIKVSSVDIISAIRGTPEDDGAHAPQKVQWRWVAAERAGDDRSSARALATASQGLPRLVGLDLGDRRHCPGRARNPHGEGQRLRDAVLARLLPHPAEPGQHRCALQGARAPHLDGRRRRSSVRTGSHR